MVSAERQQIIETNKSLRLIKNELESLLDKGVITEDAYDSIHTLLPAEGTLGRRNAEAATPASSSSTPAPAAAATRAPPPADDLANLSINDNHATPPSYAQSNPGATAGSRPPPPPPPTKPVLCHARALYAYPGSDVRDCAFERDDRIAVHEYMNPDWWMGRNLRTGREGIFPRNYVEPEPVNDSYANEKSAGYNAYNAGPPQGQAGGYYGGGGYPPQQQQHNPNPYNNPAPPMAIANPQPAQPEAQQAQQPAEGGGSKMGEMGKKIGGKFGNAAIFGAGATFGGNIVNSIF
ncbi:hypothetical protein MCOR27_003723 [Pyricularia oryzae]|uniref:SH3 domain-containing protein n=5 Tax=Pyricularia TaxID=48558 RepID=A0ABQ8NCQ6_PYRGI|nr:uncharacterized protein MGG_02835 [Pyricularia oryzae 70-15]ELQ42096.1 hypothetical protein OOU_Y34scaffold00233g22 [Pyricularia oryzae Y34]KAH8838378.1 hypothetical protein MCOR01_009816 [Pyricularia oryzae]KAI6294928.1 hypothetical protein MCOR33_008042 [Pyricularia grisea]EHA46160.1 hypothetical protein MGG_02835 [Pyricularia oryzae 70-15]KAH9436885.1 hypothetical protein MCOR02_000548 [Pyricularia oryzae]